MAVFCKCAGLLFSLLAICAGAPIVWRHKPKKRWPILAVSLLVLYLLSGGPVDWLYFVLGRPAWLGTVIGIVYGPSRWAMQNGPEWFHNAMGNYIAWWIDAEYFDHGFWFQGRHR